MNEREVVALVSGSVRTRRAVLESAVRCVGAAGIVHVICGGAFASSLAGSITLTGMITDTRHVETADFLQTAHWLAPHGCGWTWQYVWHGARAVAVQRASSLDVVAVLPARIWPWTAVATVLPRSPDRSA